MNGTLQDPVQARETANRRLGKRLLLVTLAMFGFGYALVPLYDVFCDITGLNGKTGRIDAASVPAAAVDRTRVINVEFVANVNGNLPWLFAPQTRRMTVHPGERRLIHYVVENPTAQPIVAQAVPSVAPTVASRYFDKTECFCFTRQTLAAGERREMPAVFVIDPDLPSEVGTVTLSYTFFAAPGTEPTALAQADPSR
ncbi:MAG TPA: cytochrome c oxidase assembly protein [Gammaproteobacteria bacterium]